MEGHPLKTLVTILIMSLLALCLTARCDIIPADRLTIWTPGTYTGVQGGIINRTNSINVTAAPYNCPTNGTSECSSNIQAAINACPSNGTVYIPAGNYKTTNALTLRSYITVRGAGMTSTFINLAGGNDGFSLRQGTGPFYNASDQPIVFTGPTNTSTTIGLTNTSDFTVGRMMQVTQYVSTNQYDDPLITPTGTITGGSGWQRKQKVFLLSKTTNSLSFWPPLSTDYTANPVRCVPGLANYFGVGIESLTVEMSNSTGQVGIYFEELINSWVKGVRVRHSFNYDIEWADCLQCEIRDSWIDELNHSGNNGGGLLFTADSNCLVENSVFFEAFPCLEINASSGNVFGYNFVLNTNGLFAVDTNHGPHSDFNLYEGNEATTFEADGYYGSCSQDTIYRNWISGQYTSPTNQVGYTMSLCRLTRDYSLVGNIFGFSNAVMSSDGVSKGNPNIGNGFNNGTNAPPWPDFGVYPGPNGWQEVDTNVLKTLIQFGNYNYWSNTIPPAQSLGTNTLAASLYLTNKPAWFGGLAWPPYDPTNPKQGILSIPAALMFYGSNLPPAVLGDDEFMSMTAGYSNGCLLVNYVCPYSNSCLQGSNDLKTWTDLTTNRVPKGTLVIYQGCGMKQQFVRLRKAP